MTDDSIRKKADNMLRFLGETAESVDDEATCEEARSLMEQLAVLDLEGKESAAIYPKIANHLLVCPACATEYEIVLELLAPIDEPVIHPPQPFDITLLDRAPSLTLEPQDVVLVPPQTSDPQSSRATAWLRSHPALLGGLQPAQTSQLHVRSGGQQSGSGAVPAYRYERQIHELGGTSKIEFTAALDDDQAYLSARIVPWDDLRGKTVRLYHLTHTPDPVLTLVREVSIGAMGRISVDNLEARAYLLMLAQDDREIPLTLIHADTWSKEQDE